MEKKDTGLFLAEGLIVETGEKKVVNWRNLFLNLSKIVDHTETGVLFWRCLG